MYDDLHEFQHRRQDPRSRTAGPDFRTAYATGMARERVVAARAQGPAEQQVNYALRPETLDAYVGQRDLVRKLRIAVQAALSRGDPVDHTLFHGPPGLGKTTLAHVIANEIGTRVHVTTGPALTKPADLAGILNSVGERDVLFIDEIHRVSRVVEEYLYSAMEDFKIDITLDSGPHARAVTLPLKPFTLVGATTRMGLLAGPMRSRFGLAEHLDFYPPEDLRLILDASVSRLKLDAQGVALDELARRSRGTPRIANRILRRVRDYAAVEADARITPEVTEQALALEGIDDAGLDEQDRTLLRTIATVYEGGPVGIDAVAATLGEERDTIEDVVEPFLLQQGFLTRTRQGRRLTPKAFAHLGLASPAEPPADPQPSMFDG
jgi:Holliday junction DNA helicase RuvB